MQEMQVLSVGQEDPLEKEMATHSTQYSWLENPMDRGGWQATAHGVSESDTCDWTQHIAPLAATVWKRISILQMSQLIKQKKIFFLVENHTAVEDTWLWQFCV